MVNKSRGRPSQPSDAKQRILTAARTRFETDGYTGTSLRSIAREADVDHALVSYYYGSKEGLFRAVTELVFTPAHTETATAHAAITAVATDRTLFRFCPTDRHQPDGGGSTISLCCEPAFPCAVIARRRLRADFPETTATALGRRLVALLRSFIGFGR